MSSISANGFIMGQERASASPTPKVIHSMLWSASPQKKWGYAYKTIKLTQHLFNTIARTGGRIARKSAPILKGAATRLKLFSIVDVGTNASSISVGLKGIREAHQIRDPKGVALSSMSFTLLIGDMFDSVTTFVNATLETLHRTKVVWISKIALPLATFLVTLSLASKSRRLYHLSAFNREFQRDISKLTKNDSVTEEQLRNTLAPFLNKYLEIKETGDAQKNQLAKMGKIVALNRNTSKNISEKLQAISSLLNSEHPLKPEQLEEVKEAVKSIENALKKEMVIQPLSLVATSMSAIAIALFFNPIGPAALPFALLVAGTVLQIGIKFKEDL